MSTTGLQRFAADVNSNAVQRADGERHAQPSSEAMTTSAGGERVADSALDDCSGGLHFSQQGLALMVADWARIIAERKGGSN